MDPNVMIQGGWKQVNNTLVPYIRRDELCLLPLPVLQFGAGLLKNNNLTSVIASEAECDKFNEMCSELQLNFKFSFSENIELVKLGVLTSRSDVLVLDLPDMDPLRHTKYIPTAVNGCNPSDTKQDGALFYQYNNKQDMTSLCSKNHLDCTKQDVILDLSGKTSSRHTDKYPGEWNTSCLEHNTNMEDEPMDLSVRASQSKEPSKEDIIAISVTVRPLKLFNRTIPCIVKRGVDYVLVETLRKAYFPQCSLRAFMFMIERTINPFVYDLSPEDIDSIKTFSKNPTSLLRCSKVISFDDAGKILPTFKTFLQKVADQKQNREIKQNHERNKRHMNGSINNSSSPLHSTIKNSTSPPHNTINRSPSRSRLQQACSINTANNSHPIPRTVKPNIPRTPTSPAKTRMKLRSHRTRSLNATIAKIHQKAKSSG